MIISVNFYIILCTLYIFIETVSLPLCLYAIILPNIYTTKCVIFYTLKQSKNERHNISYKASTNWIVVKEVTIWLWLDVKINFIIKQAIQNKSEYIRISKISK